MKAMQGFRYALYRNAAHEAVMRRFAGARRFVFNKGLEAQLAARDRGEKIPRYAALCELLNAWKIEYPWLKEIHSQVLQQALKDLDRVWAKRFKDLAAVKRGTMKLDAAAGEPTFRKRDQGDSFRYPQPKPEHIDAVNGRCYLPKIGWVRYRNSRPPEGAICQITVLLDGERWFVSLTMESEKSLPCNGEIVAGDRGVTDTLALSTGQRIAPLNAYRKTAFKLRRYQRAVSRKIEAQKEAMGIDPKAPFPKGVHPKKSNRQRRAELRVAKCHRKIANQRKDWLHKLTTAIADDAAVVVLEDLKIRNMSASAAGTADAPGRKVKQKSGLNKSILDQGWFMLDQMLDYKTAWRGGEVLKVPAPYTSQRCSCCGHADAASRNGKQFVCTACAHTEDADINAAKNILAAGLAVLSSRTACAKDVENSAPSGRSVKRLPLNAEGEAPCL